MKQIEWIEIARRGENHHVLFIELIMRTMKANKIGETFGEKIIFIPNYRQFDAARWFSKQDTETYINLLKNALNEKKLLSIASAYETQINKTREFATSVRKKNYSNASNSELGDCFKEFCDVTINHWSYAYHYIFINKFLPEEITAEISKKVSDPRELSDCLSVLFASDKPTETRQENIELIDLADYFSKKKLELTGKEASDLIDKHLEKYAHLKRYYFRSNPYSKKDIVERISHLTKEEIEHKKSQFIEQEKIPSKSKEIIKKLSLSEDTANKIYVSKYFSFDSNYVDESYSFLVDCSSFLLKEIANRLSVSWDELCSMRYQEILSFLENGFPDQAFKERLKRRLTDHAMVLENNEITLIEDEKLKEYYLKNKEKQGELLEIRELSGQAVSPGVVRGTAKLVFSTKDLKSINKGDILVTAMTTPEFVTAMEKASAIVTDDGGILCHAAIVSRELHLPCVVGTKKATKAFKNGNTLEVDGTNGIVRRIN